MKLKRMRRSLIVGVAAAFVCTIGAFAGFGNAPIANAQQEKLNQEETLLENFDYALLVNLPEEHISKNEAFHVSITVDKEGTFEYTYDAQGLEVISVSKTTGKVIDVTLRGTTERESAEFTLQTTFQDNSVATAKIYAVVKDCGVFLSQYFEESALRNYVYYAVENEIMTEIEGDEYLSDYLRNHGVVENSSVSQTSHGAMNSQTSLLGGAQTLADANTWAEGTVQWKDDDGYLHLLKGVTVYLYDYDSSSSSTLLGTTTTDDSGHYSFGFVNKDQLTDWENGGYDLYIKIPAGDRNAYVKDANGMYYYTSTRYMNVKTGSTTTISPIIDMGTATGQAIQISQALLTARNFARQMMGELPPDVSVRYPYTDSQRPNLRFFYTEANTTIYISSATPKAPQVSGATSTKSYASGTRLCTNTDTILSRKWKSRQELTVSISWVKIW